MTVSRDGQLVKTQHDRLAGFGTSLCVDVHCHCLPGFDDGPQDLTAALDLCRALVCEGITTAVASPHQLGRFDGCYGTDKIRQGVYSLNDILVGQGIPLKVLAGAEIRVDERLVDMVQDDQVMTLADANEYVLLELPYETFLDLGPLLHQLSEMGLRAVLAHPERNSVLAANPPRVLDWAEYAPVLQVTGSSLVGRFGPICMSAAWAFLDMPLLCAVGTDAHDTTSRSPMFAEAFSRVASERSLEWARRVCVENPLALIRGYVHRGLSRVRPAAERRIGDKYIQVLQGEQYG